jgi:hypothetical protein
MADCGRFIRENDRYFYQAWSAGCSSGTFLCRSGRTVLGSELVDKEGEFFGCFW